MGQAISYTDKHAYGCFLPDLTRFAARRHKARPSMAPTCQVLSSTTPTILALAPRRRKRALRRVAREGGRGPAVKVHRQDEGAGREANPKSEVPNPKQARSTKSQSLRERYLLD